MTPNRAGGVHREPERRSDDAALRNRTPEERARLSIDAWEPSLLRNLLKAQNKLSDKES
jgi:hypothetical protein